MESILAQCSAYLFNNAPLVTTLIVAGLVSSVSHCSLMCSPIVAAQMLTLNHREKPQSLIHFYHAGRIATYILLGLIAVSLSHFIFAGTIEPYRNSLLVLAGIAFVISAWLPRKTHHCSKSHSTGLQAKLMQLSWQRTGYFLRGMLMGLMPCGLIYAVLMAVATVSNPAEAALLMLIFGLTTLPVLQGSAWAMLKFGANRPVISIMLSRTVMGLHGLFLCGLGFNLVSIH